MIAPIAKALLTGLAIVTAGIAVAADIEAGPPPSWVAPVSRLPEAPDAGYRAERTNVLLRDTQILLRGPQSERYEHHALRINQPAALTDAGVIAISHASSFQQLTLHALAIHRDGKRIDLLGKVPFRLVDKEDSLARHLVVGTRSAIGQVPDLRVGDILEYAYVIRGSNPVFGPRGALIVPWNALQAIAQRRLRLIEEKPDTAPRVISPRGAELIEVRHVQSALGRETLLEGRNVRPIHLEPNLPADFDPFVTVAFTPYKDWAEVRRWANDLFRAPAARTEPAFDELLARLKKLPSKRAAVAEAVRFVQDDIRYFSLSIGENSHRPYPPQEVLARRFGDCKDKSQLLVRLLRGLGLTAHPALVSSTRLGGIERFPPLPNLFDHVIVNFRLDGKDYWIDPTRAANSREFDKQGTAFAGASALRVDATDPALTRIPEDEPSTLDIKEHVTVRASDAPVSFRVEARLTGRLADAVREARARQGAEANEARARETFARRYPSARASAPLQMQDDPASGALLLTERYEVGDFFRQEGADRKYAVLGAQQLASWLVANVPPGRDYPYAIPGGRARLGYEAEVSFAEGITGREDPFANHVGNEIFRLDTRRSFRGGEMRFRADLTIDRPRVRPEEFAEFLEQVRRARLALVDIVILAPENFTPASGEAPKKPLAQRTLEENRALVEQLDKTLAGGHLGGKDAAGAHVRRAAARHMLGELKGARDDYNAALRLHPLYENALAGRATVAFREGRLDAAEDDLTRAITLGADATNAYLRRGHVRYAAGRHAEALDDFEQAEKANRLGINSGFILLWKALATRALGRDPNQIADIGRAIERAGHWPNALIALIAGKLDIEAALKAADSASADERSANLCEAHFFIAHHHLLRGERDKAVDNFRAAVATGIIHFMEHDMALVALERLGENPTAR